jgi:hypothetical protein
MKQKKNMSYEVCEELLKQFFSSLINEKYLYYKKKYTKIITRLYKKIFI